MKKCNWCGKEFDPENNIYSFCCSDFCTACWLADGKQVEYDKVACPYCHSEFYVEYEYYYNEEFECEHCGRTFLLTGESSIKYTAKPIREEIEKMINERLEPIEDDDLPF